jgi:hypothetical protein
LAVLRDEDCPSLVQKNKSTILQKKDGAFAQTNIVFIIYDLPRLLHNNRVTIGAIYNLGMYDSFQA